jgi:hypothetical protein
MVIGVRTIIKKVVPASRSSGGALVRIPSPRPSSDRTARDGSASISGEQTARQHDRGLAAPVGGGHFLVDVIAGIGVAVSCIYAARRLDVFFFVRLAGMGNSRINPRDRGQFSN